MVKEPKGIRHSSNQINCSELLNDQPRNRKSHKSSRVLSTEKLYTAKKGALSSSDKASSDQSECMPKIIDKSLLTISETIENSMISKNSVSDDSKSDEIVEN